VVRVRLVSLTDEGNRVGAAAVSMNENVTNAAGSVLRDEDAAVRGRRPER